MSSFHMVPYAQTIANVSYDRDAPQQTNIINFEHQILCTTQTLCTECMEKATVTLSWTVIGTYATAHRLLWLLCYNDISVVVTLSLSV